MARAQRLTAVGALVASCWLAAGAGGNGCGGKAVVDGPPGAGGASGSAAAAMHGTMSSTMSTAQSSSVVDVGTGQDTTGVGPGSGPTGPAQQCNTQPPVGQVTNCSGGTSAVVGGQPECSSVNCDQGGHQWESDCQGTMCTCKYDGGVACSCGIQGGGMACMGGTHSCCPAPWPQ